MAHPQKSVEVILGHHDQMISNLGLRMTGVEGKLDTVVDGINKLSTAITLQQQKPSFDASAVISIIKDSAFIIAAGVAAIIWVTTGQYAGVTARQDETNKHLIERVSRIEKRTEWVPHTVEKK